MGVVCVIPCGPSATDVVPSNTGPSNSRIVAVTPTALGLYTPTFVRESPFTSPVNTVTALAADDGNPGTNIPTKPPPATGDRNCEETTRLPAAPVLVNSTAPRELGASNKLTQMSSNARDSRAPSENCLVAPLNRYTAVTANTSVYDVLNTLTPDTNGTPPAPTTDAATGNVTVSTAKSAPAAAASGSARRSTLRKLIEWFLSPCPRIFLSLRGKVLFRFHLSLRR